MLALLARAIMKWPVLIDPSNDCSHMNKRSHDQRSPPHRRNTKQLIPDQTAKVQKLELNTLLFQDQAILISSKS